MSRPGPWSRVISNIGKYLRKDWSQKIYVGEDSVGHRYYEIKNSRQNVNRGFEPPKNIPSSQPGLEWQAWLKGTRRFPPSDNEIALNRSKQQAQLTQDADTERRAPKVQSEGRGAGDDRGPTFPTYKDMEISPGAKKSD